MEQRSLATLGPARGIILLGCNRESNRGVAAQKLLTVFKYEFDLLALLTANKRDIIVQRHRFQLHPVKQNAFARLLFKGF